jgi:DNA-binding HxlR family transcriptional regulator
VRSGTQALSLLAAPLNIHILQALEEEPTPLPSLRRAVGYPPVTTLRSYLRTLTKLGAIERQREEDFPGSISYTITKSGARLLEVAELLERWLETAPEGALELGSTASKSVIKALADGWDIGLVRALAARPLTLTELDRLIPSVTYPALERRLTAMRQVGLLEPCPERNGRGAPCQVTPWLRYAVRPLSGAMGWESQCMREQAPAPGPLDVEAAFLLAMPLLAPTVDASGTCRVAVEFRRGSEHEFAGVMVTFAEGGIRACVTRLEGRPDAWVSGSAVSWFRWLSEGDDQGMDIGGDGALTHPFEDGVRGALLPTAGG